jgi:hypothetical protein
MFREDYLMRVVRQFAEALRRIAGLRRDGEHARAMDEIERLRGELLAGPRELVDDLDSASLATLLGDPEKIRVAAMLAWEEGRILTAKADPLTAFARYRQAHELLLEARARAPHPDDSTALFELSRVAPAWHLAPRYRGEAEALEEGATPPDEPGPGSAA